jgi:hypothetical protein
MQRAVATMATANVRRWGMGNPDQCKTLMERKPRHDAEGLRSAATT